jgi:hypothetical protein
MPGAVNASTVYEAPPSPTHDEVQPLALPRLILSLEGYDKPTRCPKVSGCSHVQLDLHLISQKTPGGYTPIVGGHRDR